MFGRVARVYLRHWKSSRSRSRRKGRFLRRKVYGRGYDNLILSVHWRRESIVICTSKSKPILEPWPEANDERRRFKIVTAHPTVGPLSLILGVSGLNGPGESVADISDAFLNAGRVEKERLKLEHGSDAVGGDSFIATLAKVPKEHPGFVITSRIDKVFVKYISALGFYAVFSSMITFLMSLLMEWSMMRPIVGGGPEGTEPSPDGQVGILLGPRFRNGASAYHFTYTFLPSSRVSLTQGN